MNKGTHLFRKPVLHILLVAFLLLTAEAAAYAGNKTTIYFFWGNGCPHCNKEKIFLDGLEKKYPELEIKSYEVWYNLENAILFAQMSKAYGKKIEGVPSVFIGDFDPIVGYHSDESTGKLLEDKIAYCIGKGCINPADKISASVEQKVERTVEPVPPPDGKKEPKAPPAAEVSKKEKMPEPQASVKEEPAAREAVVAETPPAKEEAAADRAGIVKLPLLGEIDTSRTSLPVLTLIIAGMDGFNPCAFFVLLVLLSVLVYARSRKTMLLIGGTFVFFSGFIYFLFMAAWLNLFLIFGQLKIITVVAGSVAIVIALINIKDFFFFKKGVSLTIPESAKPKLYDRTRGLLKKSSLPSMMFGAVVLAVAANTYELLCTAGFPMVYTRALTLHRLPVFEYYLYLVFYNIIYVIPLAVIVVTVAITLGAKKMSEMQGQVLKLISGMMMLSLGVVLLTRPDLLNNVIVSAGLLGTSLLLSGVVVLVTRVISRDREA